MEVEVQNRHELLGNDGTNISSNASRHSQTLRTLFNKFSIDEFDYLFIYFSNFEFKNTPERRSIQTTRASSASWNSTHVDEFSDSHSESLYLFVDSFSAAMFRSEEQRTEPNDGGERIDLDAMSRLIEHT